MTKKIITYKKPKFLAEKLGATPDTGTRSGSILFRDKASLSMLNEGFVSRGAKLFNQIPADIKSEANMSKFKKSAKHWIKTTISLKTIVNQQ